MTSPATPRPSSAATCLILRFWTGTRPSEAIALRRGDVDLSNRRIRIRRSRVLGEDGRPKTGRSKRDVIIHEGLEAVLQAHMPPAGPPMTPSSRRVPAPRSMKRTQYGLAASRFAHPLRAVLGPRLPPLGGAASVPPRTRRNWGSLYTVSRID